MQATACKDDSDYMLMERTQPASLPETDGPTLNCRNPVLQMSLERMTTPETKVVFQRALGQADKPLGLMMLMLCLTSFMHASYGV